MAFFGSSSFFLSLFTSLLLWLSFPGGGEVWFLLFVALVPLLYAVRGATARRAALCGLVCGLVHFTALLYWIVIVLGKYGGLPWFIAVPALLLLALYMSVYLALFTLLARFILLMFPAAVSLFLLPALWVGIDWLRSVLFTGFPWMDLGYGLYAIPRCIQIADLVGHYGVTFGVVLVNVSLMLMAAVVLASRGSLSRVLPILIPTLLVLGAAAAYSEIRLAGIQRTITGPGASRVIVGIVQGNIDQGLKWSPDQQEKTVEKYLAETRLLFSSGQPSLVVWPETALPFYPPANNLMLPLGELVAENNFALLTGAPWYEIIDREKKKVNYYNGALLLRPDGRFGGKYFKSHLVPFGEYVPLKEYLFFLEPLVEAVGDFSRGTIDRPLTWQRVRAGVLICYESVFSDLARDWVLAGANMLVNLTNDAWYGKSSAPQHSLAMSVLRAVETRRSLIRSANTGISAFIAPTGAIVRQSEIFVPWAKTSPVVLSSELTFWTRCGYWFAPVCLAIGLLGGLAAGLGRRSKGEMMAS